MARQAGSGARGAGWWSTVTALVYVPFARFLGVLAVAIVALVLGGIGLEQYLTGPHAPSGFGRGFWDIVYYDLQLPVLSSPRRRAQALTRCRLVSPASWRRWARSSPLWARSSC